MAEAIISRRGGGGGKQAPWIHDWDAYATHNVWHDSKSVAKNIWTDLVNFSGAGALTFFQCVFDTTNATEKQYRIIVDGVTKEIMTLSENDWQYPMILTPLIFTQNLCVQVRHTTATVKTVTYDYSCLLQTNKPRTGYQSFIEASSVKGFHDAMYESKTLVNITGAGYLVTAGANGNYGTNLLFTLDGVQFAELYAQDSLPSVFYGPKRYTTSLKIETVRKGAGTTSLMFVYTAD